MATVFIRVRPHLADGRLTRGTKDSEPYAHLLGRRVGHVFEAFELDAKTLRRIRTVDLFEVSFAMPRHMMVRGRLRADSWKLVILGRAAPTETATPKGREDDH